VRGSLKKIRIQFLSMLIWVFICASISPAQDTPPPADEVQPLMPPRRSTILLAVDYNKKTRVFPGGFIALPAPKGDDLKAWDFMKESGTGLVEITVKDNGASLFPSGDKDPSDPAAYDFSVMDGRVAKAIEMGSAVMLIIESPRFPENPGRFSAILDNTLKHLTQGWGGGFRLSERELCFVVLDAAPDRPGSSWEGKDDECLRLYSLFARSVRKAHPKIGFGGPGFTRVFSDDEKFLFKEISPSVTSWMEAIAKGKVPFDLFYMRCRSMLPYPYFLQTRTVEEKVLASCDKLSPLYGRPRIGLRCDVLPSGLSNSLFATSLANALMCAIKGGVDLVVIPREVQEQTPLADVIRAMNIFRDYPVQLETVGLDRLCFIMMTARSNDGKKAAFMIAGNSPVSYVLGGGDAPETKEIERELRGLVDNFTDREYPPSYERYHLNVEKLPWEKDTILYKRLIIDDTHRLECREEKEFEGRKELYFNERITLPSLHVILLEAKPQDEAPKEKNP